MQIIKPKLKFVLFLAEKTKNNTNNYYNKDNYNKDNNNSNSVICFAETFETKEDGSIIFYQICKVEDKRLKVPVLCYPAGTWTGCALLDQNNSFPVFNNSPSTHQYNERKQIEKDFEDLMPEPPEPSDFEQPKPESRIEDNGSFGDLEDSFSSKYQNNIVPVPKSMPGINQQNNPQDFKRQKEEWLESEIKKYTRDNEIFHPSEFLSYLQKQSMFKTYKTTETEIIWNCSKLIRAKQILTKKFDLSNQKILSLILPDIMKRQWDGKMGTILQILQDKEETKNVTAIDLAIWMSQNNYS